MAKKKPSSASKNAGESVPEEVTFFYEKSNQHRSIYIEGLHGAISPTGQITVSFYHQRFPTPIESTHAIDESGRVGQLKTVKTVKGIVREIEVTGTMSPKNAREIGEWLLARAVDAESELEALESTASDAARAKRRRETRGKQ